MATVLRYLQKQDWLFMLCSLIAIIFQVWLSLKLPDYMSEITKLVQTEGSAMEQILIAGGKMLLCAVGSLAAAVITGFFVAKASASISMRLREALFHKTMTLSMETLNQFSTASLITRSTNDITQVKMAVMMGLQIGVRAPIMAVWAILKIYGKSELWTAVTAIFVCILLAMLGTLFALVIPKFTILQRLTDNLNRVAREQLTGLRVVRAYGAEAYQEAKFERANRKLTETNLFTNRLMAIVSPGMQLIMSGLTLTIYWTGVAIINKADMVDRLHIFSDMIVFSSYAAQVISAFMMMTMMLVMIPRAVVSVKRICEVLNAESSMADGTAQTGEAERQGEIQFRHVSFRYPDGAGDVLQDISFTVRPGETLALIGPTASGKSTLVNLIPRFYDVTAGEVLIDGINVQQYKQEALRQRLGYVPQETVLFSGTVASNVAYGDNGQGAADEKRIEKSLEIAQAAEFVAAMEDGCNAAIARSGANISGGQKQRLAIARAVCRQPQIYIFDDCFSALDYQTDRRLRQKLRQETAGATTIIVAQRIGTILDADKIIVLDNGRMVGMGKHKELLETCPVYQEIAKSQLSEEDLTICLKRMKKRIFGSGRPCLSEASAEAAKTPIPSVRQQKRCCVIAKNSCLPLAVLVCWRW